MEHLHPAFALALFVEAFLMLHFIRQWGRFDRPLHRISSIDGLRGFLAFGVFVHHAAIWYIFLKSGSWVVPESRLYSQLGQTTVTLFFMITGFLFYKKLLDSQQKSIDWLSIYVGRCLRILPLYLVTLILSVTVIAIIRYSGWAPVIASPWNEKSLIGLITAGVTWTLSYEWKFYYALPLIAVTLGRVYWKWIVFSIVMLLISGINNSMDIHACAFIGGILAALLDRFLFWRNFAQSGWGSCCALTAIVVTIAFFDTAYAKEPLALLAAAFALIANGASIWGLLRTELSRILGEITYSIYLLHGPILFTLFYFIIGFEAAAKFEPIQHWIIICAVTPVILIAALISTFFFEYPTMAMANKITQRLRAINNNCVQKMKNIHK